MQGASWGTPWHLGVGVAIPRAAPLDARATPHPPECPRSQRHTDLAPPRATGPAGTGSAGSTPIYLIYSYKIEPVRRGVAICPLFASWPLYSRRRTRSVCLCELEGEASRRALRRARVAARERWRPGSRSLPPRNTCTSKDSCDRHSVRPRTRRLCEVCRHSGFVRAFTMCVWGGSGGVTAACAGGACAHAPSTAATAANSTGPVTSGGKRTQAEKTPSSLWVGSGLSAALPGRETLPPQTP